jgi:hypothetical protein
VSCDDAAVQQTTSPVYNEHVEFPLLSTTQYFEVNLWDYGAPCPEAAAARPLHCITSAPAGSVGDEAFLGGVLVPIECVPPEGAEMEVRGERRGR